MLLMARFLRSLKDNSTSTLRLELTTLLTNQMLVVVVAVLDQMPNQMLVAAMTNRILIAAVLNPMLGAAQDRMGAAVRAQMLAPVVRKQTGAMATSLALTTSPN